MGKCQLTLEKYDIYRQEFTRHDKEETLWELQAVFMTMQFSCWGGQRSGISLSQTEIACRAGRGCAVFTVRGV